MPAHGAPDSEDEDVFHDAHFPAEEEASLLAESHATKADANKLFSSSRYSEAIATYDRALASCPNYLDFEVAVLRGNIAACHLKLEDWKSALESATASLECLDRGFPSVSAATKADDSSKERKKDEKDSTDGVTAVVEITDEDGEAEELTLAKLQKDDEERENVRRIRAKALMRRARARTELQGWANLQGAEEDYKELAGMGNLPPQDLKVVQKALLELPSKINKAKEKEMGEMMGKLKDLGNGILKPFGLSTDNFKMVKDEKTGGYSMSFEGGK